MTVSSSPSQGTSGMLLQAALFQNGALVLGPVSEIECDDMEFSLGDKSRVVSDEVVLGTSDPIERLAASYAFAQSVKLSVLETRVNKTISKTQSVPIELARTGKINLTSVDISKKIGLLFVERNTVNTTDLLDTPEFLWESDEFEPIFERMQSYLDIERRVDLLNQRLDVIKELLEMLSTQLEA